MYYFITIMVLALAGLGISAYIYWSKLTKKKMVCILGGNCNSVVDSKYSKTLGFPNEVIGFVYYFFVLFVFSLFFTYPYLEFTKALLVIKTVMAAAAVASIYLIFVQAFVIKDFCEWCLGTAVINVLLYVLFYLAV